MATTRLLCSSRSCSLAAEVGRPFSGRLLATLALVILSASILVDWSPMTSALALGEDPKEGDDKSEELTADPYAIPDGTPEEILEVVEKLKTLRPKITSQKEAVEHAVKLHRALIAAGDKILAQETDVKVAVNAAQLKLSSLTLLAMNNIEDFPKEAMVAATKLKKDERPDVAKVAQQYFVSIRISNLKDLIPTERAELINELIASVSESHFSRESTRNVSQLGDLLANQGDVEQAGDLFDRIAKLARESDDPKIQSTAERFDGIARKTRLPGHFMEIKGKVLGGDDLDWGAYRGKVVLVDFWATWCGPCIAELPNVKTHYKKYHDKGFDVVGISLDRSREPLDKFIEKHELPWAQMYDEEVQKDQGWNHPMAQYFGINAIPAAILVDQEGKVVSLRARGPELAKLLEKLLGPADPTE